MEWIEKAIDKSSLVNLEFSFRGALWSSMTILENICLPLECHTSLSTAEVEEISRYKMSLVGLSGFEELYPAQMSGGMRKRAGLREQWLWTQKYSSLMNLLLVWIL